MDVMDMFPDRISPEPNSGCWLWDGPLMDGKYGGVYVDGVRHYVHRFSLSLKEGAELGRDYAIHSCDVKLCVNPDHLRRGDQWDNMRDMAERDRSRSHIRAATVLQIRELSRCGMTQQTIAARFGIGQSTVSGIVRMGRRTHIRQG